MRIHATREEVDALPEPARAFLDAAWSAPDEDGQRPALDHFDGIERIGAAMALCVRNAMQEPGAVDTYFTFSLMRSANEARSADEAPQMWLFGQGSFFKDRSTEIAFNLVTAWNSRVTLAECAVCKKLMQPGKGRIARTCSPQCRLELHRKGAAA